MKCNCSGILVLCPIHSKSFNAEPSVTTPINELALDFDVSDKMNYLKEGDRLRLVKGAGGPAMNRTQVFAVAAMDGHSVSPHYGKGAGTDYFDDPEKTYINVRFQHVNYGGQDGRPSWAHPNDTIKPTEGWKIFVTRNVYNRIWAVVNQEEKAAAEAAKEAKRQELREQISKLNRELEELG